MPTFSSAQVTDPFLSTNELLAPMAAFDTHANTLLQQQEHQQSIGLADMATVARAAAPLLGMSEADAAAAYPGIVADLQRQGFAKQAPSTYPGHAATQSLVQRGMTVPEQYQYGLLTAPGVTDALKAASGPLTSGNPGGGGGAAEPGMPSAGGGPRASLAIGQDQIANAKAIHAGLVARGMDNETALAMAANSLGESGGNWQTNPGDGGASHGLFQWNGDRLAAFQAANGGKLPGQTSLDAQLDFATNEWKADHNGAATAAGRFGTAEGKIAPIVSKYEVSANQPADIARRSAYLNQLRAAGVGLGAAPATPPPFNPNAGPRVAGAPPAGAPGPAATPGFGPLTPVPGAPTVTGQADVPAPVTPSPVALRTGGTDVAGPGAGPDTTLPPVAQPNRLYETGLPGIQITGPTNALAPPAAAAPAAPVAQAPAAVPAPPATRPATGQNSPQFQAALELNRRAQALDLVVDPTGRTKALAASLRAQAALYMQADSVVKGPGGVQIHTLTGKEDDPAKPLADYHETSPGSGIWVGGPGTEPRFQPPGRLVVGPDGTVWQTGVGGARVLQSSDPQAIAARKAAEAAGTAAGSAMGKLPGELADQGREAARAIGNIDYGMGQIAKAQQGGINTGYFAPWLGTVSAIAKSLGGETGASLLGIDPAAVGNIQTAQKTLAIVSSAILQQALGGAQITDAKIQHFIHAQPGIETDPDALRRVLNWARSQFVYEQEMAQAGMKDVSPATGTLPADWQAKYYATHGFAPIYNPGTGEMQQPEGQGPTREPPAAPVKRPPLSSFAR